MPKLKLDELIISGGGAHNKYILNELQRFLPGINIMRIEELGFSSDAKEAVAFAILVNETIAGNPSNMVYATGAKKRTVLGKVCLG